MVKSLKKTTKAVTEITSDKKYDFATGAMKLKATSTSGVKVEAASKGLASNDTTVNFEYADAAAGVALKKLTFFGAAEKHATLGLEFSKVAPNLTVNFDAEITANSTSDSVKLTGVYAKDAIRAEASLSLLSAMSFAKDKADAKEIATLEFMTDQKAFTFGAKLGLGGKAGAVAPSLSTLVGYKKDALSAFVATSGLSKADLAFDLSAYYQYSSAVGAAASINSKTSALQIGCDYALDSDTKLKSKASFVNNADSVPFSFVLTQKLRPSVELSLPFQFKASKAGAVTLSEFGFALAMGDL